VLVLFGDAARSGELFELHEFPAPVPGPDVGWGRLAEVIRTDRPVPEPGVGGQGDPEALRRFHAYLAEAGSEPARELWQQVQVEGPLLDLGGGTGTYASQFVQIVQNGRAVLADRADVLALSPFPEKQVVDLLSVGYSMTQQFGCVLLCNVLHLFGPDESRQIVQNARACLRPGGRLLVKDLLIEPDRSGPEEGVLFALNMAVFTERGDVHDPQVLQGLLGPCDRVQLATSPGSIVLVSQPPAPP
jgi:SAM-dependent methyltransferase